MPGLPRPAPAPPMRLLFDWFRLRRSAAAAAGPAAPRVEPRLEPPLEPGLEANPATPDPAAATPTRAELDAAFLATLTGRPVAAQPLGSLAERRLLQRVAALADPARFDPAQLPRLPSVLPALLQQLRAEPVDARGVARLIARDAVLLGAIMRMAGSAQYATGDPIRTLMQAILRVGDDGLRSMVLRAIALPIWCGDLGVLARQAAPRCATHAEACAAACMAESRDQGERFEGYLAGLFAFTGALPLLRAIDREPGLAEALGGVAWSAAFEAGTATLSALAADHWQLPPTVVTAITERGGDAARPRTALGQRLDRADRGVRQALLDTPGAGAPPG